MNPQLQNYLSQIQMLQQMLGPAGSAAQLPSAIGNPLRVNASQAGDMDQVRMIESLMGRRPAVQTPGYRPPSGDFGPGDPSGGRGRGVSVDLFPQLSEALR